MVWRNQVGPGPLQAHQQRGQEHPREGRSGDDGETRGLPKQVQEQEAIMTAQPMHKSTFIPLQL